MAVTKDRALARMQWVAKCQAVLKEYVEKNSNDLFDRCKEILGVQDAPFISDIHFLLDYFGVSFGDCTRKCERYNSQPIEDVQRAASRFVQNVFPFQRKNFIFQSTIKTTNKFYHVYSNVPPEVAQALGDNGTLITQPSYNDVETKTNAFFSIMADAISNDIDFQSKFHRTFQDAVISMFVTQCVWAVSPSKTGHGADLKLLDPISVIPEYDDQQNQIAFCRLVKIKQKNFYDAYPNAFAEPSGMSKKQRESIISLYEYSFKQDIDGKTMWCSAVFDVSKQLCVLKFYEYCPYIVEAEHVPLYSNLGQGRLLFLANDIRGANELAKNIMKMRLYNSNKPWEVVSGKLKTGKNSVTISPGALYHVSQPGVFIPFPDANDTPLLTALLEYNTFISRAILGEPLTNDPRAKATLTNAQLQQQAQFFVSSASKTIHSLVFKIVQADYLVSRAMGTVYDNLYQFFMSPNASMPDWLLFFAERAEMLDNEKLRSLYNQYLTNWIYDIVDSAGDLTDTTFKIVSPAGMQQNLEDVQTISGFLTTCSNLLQKPVSSFASEERTINSLSEKFGIDANILLTDKEKEEQAKMMAAIQQQQEMQQG